MDNEKTTYHPISYKVSEKIIIKIPSYLVLRIFSEKNISLSCLQILKISTLQVTVLITVNVLKFPKTKFLTNWHKQTVQTSVVPKISYN